MLFFTAIFLVFICFEQNENFIIPIDTILEILVLITLFIFMIRCVVIHIPAASKGRNIFKQYVNTKKETAYTIADGYMIIFFALIHCILPGTTEILRDVLLIMSIIFSIFFLILSDKNTDRIIKTIIKDNNYTPITIHFKFDKIYQIAKLAKELGDNEKQYISDILHKIMYNDTTHNCTMELSIHDFKTLIDFKCDGIKEIKTDTNDSPTEWKINLINLIDTISIAFFKETGLKVNDLGLSCDHQGKITLR